MKSYLPLLGESNPRLAAEARQEIDAALDLLTRYPRASRQSLRWQAYREKSFRRCKKIIVFRVTDTFIRVHRVLDMRQDLDRVRL